MFLSDNDLMALGERLVSPFSPDCVGPASIDLHLSKEFAVPGSNHRGLCVDIAEPVAFMSPLVNAGEEGFVLHPGEFVLGVTVESVNCPNNMVGRLEGKASLGRIGLMAHITSGMIDPGFHGCLTLQMTNVLRIPILLRPGVRICQVMFAHLQTPARNPYPKDKRKSVPLPSMGFSFEGEPR